MRENMNQYVAVIIWLVSSKESQCVHHWKNVAFAEAGASYETFCDGSRIGGLGTKFINKVELYWDRIRVFRYLNGVVMNQTNRAELWKIKVSGLESHGVKEDNSRKYNVTIHIPKLAIEDQGSFQCKIYFHNLQSNLHSSLAAEILYLFVKEPSEKDLCEKKSFYYRKREVCVKLIQSGRTWPAAREHCRRVEDGRLVVTKSKPFEMFVAGLAIKSGPYIYWVGSIEGKTQRHYWVDEDISNSSQAENITFYGQHCGKIDTIQSLDLITYAPCTDSKYFVCEMGTRRDVPGIFDLNFNAILIGFFGSSLVVLVVVCVLMALPRGKCVPIIEDPEAEYPYYDYDGAETLYEKSSDS